MPGVQGTVLMCHTNIAKRLYMDMSKSGLVVVSWVGGGPRVLGACHVGQS